MCIRDRTLRGGTVGGNDLGNNTDGIGEVLHRGQHGDQRALSQRTVADLAAAGATGGLCFADGVAGEVVVVHIALFRFLPDGVQLLVGGEGVQRAGGEHLRLTASEQAGAVNPCLLYTSRCV